MSQFMFMITWTNRYYLLYISVYGIRFPMDSTAGPIRRDTANVDTLLYGAILYGHCSIAVHIHDDVGSCTGTLGLW